VLAQRRFPGSPNNLDALCRRFAVDGTARTLHGALLDCELLAEVYLHLIGGRQTVLGLDRPGDRRTASGIVRIARPPRPYAPSAEELAAHAAFVAKLDDPVWSS
jgi:DNA polymerase-3 subunit epsilon